MSPEVAEFQIKTSVDELKENARFKGRPDQAFIGVMKSHKRRGIRYEVEAKCKAFRLDLTVHASGLMEARFDAAGIVFEGGDVHHLNEHERICWADTGEGALIPTNLDGDHLHNGEASAADILQAFLDAFGVHTRAACVGGYDHWLSAMRLYACRIASEAKVPIEIVHHLPLMPAPCSCGIDTSRVQQVVSTGRCHVFDLTDSDSPREMHDYEDEIMKLQAEMSPEAMELVLLAPGYVIRRPHCEIIHASPDGRWG